MIIARIQKKGCDHDVLADLMFWNDETARDGPENMAVDQWLWSTVPTPLLRVYRWAGDWMSIGYFSSSREVPAGREFVRRPTGGGLVDHSDDWTYTLMVPRGYALAEMKGSASYQVIHQAVCDALALEGTSCYLLADDEKSESAFCFGKAVAHDLVDAEGRKLAGAGQRRGKHGLLHQGSVQASTVSTAQRGMHLAQGLGARVREVEVPIDEKWIANLRDQIFGTDDWSKRR
jgi:lipoate-protein ligase A